MISAPCVKWIRIVEELAEKQKRPPNESDRFTAILLSLNRPVERDFSPNKLDSRRKPGRKPPGPERQFDYEKVYNLRKDGLSFGEIAQRLWNDPSKRNLASAHYQRALKLGFPPIKPSGK